MADSALLMRWDRVVPGREQQGLHLFGQALEYYGSLQSEGAIESFEPVLLDPSGTRVNGIILLRGTADQLAALRRQERYIDIVMPAQYLCEDFAVSHGYLEGELQARMGKGAQIISQ